MYYLSVNIELLFPFYPSSICSTAYLSFSSRQARDCAFDFIRDVSYCGSSVSHIDIFVYKSCLSDTFRSGIISLDFPYEYFSGLTSISVFNNLHPSVFLCLFDWLSYLLFCSDSCCNSSRLHALVNDSSIARRFLYV